MIYLPGILIAIIILAIITKPFTILFHELGHAIPAMLFTKKAVDVYVGSYGDKTQCIKIVITKLNIWIRYNPLKWGGGFCVVNTDGISFNKVAIYTLCGPLFTFFIASGLLYLTLNYNLHGSLKLIFSFAVCSTILDLFNNLIPRRIKLSDGSTIYSDGYFLFHLKELKRFPLEYENAVNNYANKEYEKTSKIFENYIERGFVNEDVFRYASISHMLIGNYEKANEIQKKFENKYELNADDFYNLGLTSSYLGREEERTKYIQKAFEQDPNHSYTLNILAYDMICKGEFEKAIPLLDRAIDNQKDLAFAYNNRGHANIEIGQLDEGLKDVQHSLLLDKENSYVYRNLGIYHLRLKQHSKALEYFLQAKEMDKDTDSINNLINDARSKLL